MKKASFLFTTIILIGLCGCSDVKKQKHKTIMIVIENSLISPLKNSMERYKTDLENEGYIVIPENNIDSSTKPSVIRQLIQKEFDNEKGLIGAVFIGNIAAPPYNEKK
jgi:transcriptional/translational regulatory protein YebC/TACO1